MNRPQIRHDHNNRSTDHPAKGPNPEIPAIVKYIATGTKSINLSFKKLICNLLQLNWNKQEQFFLTGDPIILLVLL